MASCVDVDLCGLCGKVFKDGDKSIFCELYCEKWFHIKCLNIKNSDYEKIQSLGKHSKWFCDPCERKVKKNKEDNKEMCCDCFSYVNVLTDTVKEITENQREMSKNFQKIQIEQIEMKESMRTMTQCYDDVTGQDEIYRNIENETIGTVSKKQNVNTKRYLSNNNDNNRSKTENTPIRENRYEIETSNGIGGGDDDNDDMENQHGDLPLPTSLSSSGSGDDAVMVGCGSFKVVERNNKKRSYSNVLKAASLTLNSKEEERDKSSADVHMGKRKQEHEGKNLRPRQKPMIGTAKGKPNDSFGVIKKVSLLFATRFAPNTKKESVQEYVKGLCNGDLVTCEELNTKYPTYKSFKIGFPEQFSNAVMDCEKWPQGILINKFYPSNSGKRKVHTENRPRPTTSPGLQSTIQKNLQ